MSFKFTVIKKNQILASAVTLMLVTAGYLNYKYDPTRPYDIEVTGIIEENLGDAVLLDSNGMVQDFALGDELENVINNTLDSTEYVTSQDGTTPVFQNNTSLVSGDANVAKDTKVFKEIDDYFISTRIDRTNNYAEQIESYENILESPNTNETQKNRAQEEIERINGIRNSIMIAENLIKLKGFEEVVILVNDNSINVIVAAENLSSVEIAQIQSVIVNEFEVVIENVHIINYD